MELYEYLIGGKKTGRIDDLKDVIPGSKPFRELKEGEAFFVSEFKPDGTCTYADEIKITSIHKKPTGWVFTGLTEEGEEYAHSLGMGDLDKKLEVRKVRDQRIYYKVFSTFKMDDGPLFELVKKEIKNFKNK